MLESSLELQTRNLLNSKQFNCVRKIGKGGFGHVLLATKATSSSVSYAIKCLSKKKMIKDLKKKIRGDLPMSKFEEECATAWGVWEMCAE